MALELPLLRIGLAGFSLEQQDMLRQLLDQDTATRQVWDFTRPEDADALCVNGARTQLLPDGMLRVAAGVTGGRSTLIDPKELHRPIAFARPLPHPFPPYLSFDLEPHSVALVLRELEVMLRPLIAQFCLASQILEQEQALGSGVYHVTRTDGALVAVVDLRGDVGVLPTASALDFDGALWVSVPRQPNQMPPQFLRCSLSRLMWEYAMRTDRDVLPPRYRTETLYFRRPPRLPHRLLADAHLLILRELSSEPGNFKDLQQRTGLTPEVLAQDLAALYLVGAITSNTKRAAPLHSQPNDAMDGVPSTQAAFDSSRRDEGPPTRTGPQTLQPIGPRRADRTAPAPLQLDH
ncbi:hypothetical protein ACPWT1_00935 [Ramlibacter sp. MMS24-I3-19]|uniref:hypothetical protein n=1 Tax=Ramlibacter sp. MMS24-I3-19 TaxID=3416606 RepID=UPI003D048FEE